MKYNLFIGRWAPFHEGHKYIIDSFINNGKAVCIGIRDTPMSIKDPFTAENRKKIIDRYYKDNPKVKSIIIPDIESVCVGRGVGYNIIDVPQDIKIISGTKTRQVKNKVWNNGKGRVIWLTGMPCSGKTTIINGVKEIIDKLYPVDYQILDGDVFRKEVTPHLGFSENDRMLNLETAAKIAKTLKDQGLIVLAGFVSPLNDMRDCIKNIIGDNFYLVHIKASQNACSKRDVKGMWAKAKDGEIKGFTGYDAPYEDPKNPDLVLNSELDSLKMCTDKIMNLITGE